MNWYSAGSVNGFTESPRKSITIHNVPLIIFYIDNVFYAIEDRCPHQDLPLSEGPLEGNILTCPYHGAQFCIKTGAVLSPPAFSDLETFQTQITGDELQIALP